MEQTFKKGDRVVCSSDQGLGTFHHVRGDLTFILRDDGKCYNNKPYYTHNMGNLTHDRDFSVGDWVRYEGTHPTVPDSHLNGQIGKIKELLNQDTVSVSDIYDGAGIFKCNLVKIAPPAEGSMSKHTDFGVRVEIPDELETVTIEHDQWGRVEGVYNANSVAFFKKERGVEMWYNKNEGWREVKPKRWVPVETWIGARGDSTTLDVADVVLHLPLGYRWKIVEIEREISSDD